MRRMPGPWTKIVLIGAAAVLLQQVSVGYPLAFGSTFEPNASLLHLHVGLLLAVGMLERDRRVLAGSLAIVTLGWAIRAWGMDYVPGLFASALLVAIGTYFWIRLCAGWMGWPRAPGRMRLECDELPRHAIVGLAVFPLGMTVMGLLAMPWLPPADLVLMLLQMLFAKYFGVAVVTLPLVVGWTERHRRAPQRLRHAWFGMLLMGLLSLASIAVSHVATGSTLAASGRIVLMDYRFALFAALGWAVLHLRPRASMPLLSLAVFGMVAGLAATASRSGTTSGFVNLLHLAIEIGILSTVLLYLLLLSRDGHDLSTRLAEESRRDAITRLPNVNAMRHRLVESPPPSRRELGYLVLAGSDAMTGGYGLEAQAMTMNETALRISDLVEPYAVGTGQFLLLARESPAPGNLWEQVIARVEQIEIGMDRKPIRLTPYVGVAECAFDDRAAIDAAILDASHLAHEATRHNEIRPLYGSARTSSRGEHVRSLHETAEALACLRENRIALHFQRLARVHGELPGERGLLHGEVLCRLVRPDGSLLPPARFLSSLLAAGRGPELDLAVLTALLAWFRAHPQAIPRCGRVAVNLTGQSLVSATFRTRLLALLAQSPIPHDRLCFEVTENPAAVSMSGANPLLLDLHLAGCRIAIDDFGVGMQSFERLRDMPVDMIKIDGSFVRNVARRGKDHAVVQASVAVARAFGAATVAEYVEDEETVQCLRELGVDWLQGYLVARPVALAQAFASDG